MIAADVMLTQESSPGVDAGAVGRPVIGVTGPDEGGLATWLFTALAIWRAGGRPRRVTPSRPCEIDELDGLVLGGGADVDPRLFGLQSSPRELAVSVRGEITRHRALSLKLFAAVFYPLLLAARRVMSLGTITALDRERDALECSLLGEAFARELPVLGVCRGAQLLNAYLGGALHPEVAKFYIERPQLRTVMPRKRVRLAPNSRLAGMLGGHEARVNALHHQAGREPGERVNVVARDRGGAIQAIEHTGHRFALGLQWHPEFLPQSDRQQAIFRELVRHSRLSARARSTDARTRADHRLLSVALALLTIFGFAAASVGCGEASRRELEEARVELQDVQRERQETREELRDVSEALVDASRAAAHELAGDVERELAGARERLTRLARALDRARVDGDDPPSPRADALVVNEHVRCRGDVCEFTTELVDYLEAHPDVALRQGGLAPWSDERGAGLRVLWVAPESVPARLGVAPGDVISELDGQPVRGFADLLAPPEPPARGQELRVTIRRGDDERVLRLRAVDRLDHHASAASPAHEGRA